MVNYSTKCRLRYLKYLSIVLDLGLTAYRLDAARIEAIICLHIAKLLPTLDRICVSAKYQHLSMNMTARLLIFLALIMHVSTAFVVNQPIQNMPTSPLSIQQRDLFRTKSTRTSQVVSLIPDTAPFVLAVEQSSSLSLDNQNVWIFIAGLIPFGWAAVEFWRRIAVGQPFGTGTDSVYIGRDNAPSESRGRRVLDRGAFLVAYVLFGVAAAAICMTLFSVVTSPPLMDDISSVTPPL